MSLDATSVAIPAPTRKSLSSSRSTEMKNLFRHTITSTERSAITQYILDAENDIKDYQAEINRLKTTIWTLENKKDALQKSMKRFRFLLSPVYKLPPEILITIFNFCCETNDLQVKGDSLPMALTLSRVCGRWRDILLSTPRLWRSLSIYFYGWAPYQQKLSGLARMFMTRSEKLGLRIELDFTNGDEKLEVILPALTTLISNSSRWTALKLIVPASVIKHRVFETVRGHLSKLEYLYLTGCGPTEDVEDAHVDLFEDCPSLRSFEYKASSPSIIATVPWHQIKSLKLCNYYSTFAFDRLALCRNAQRLTLHIVGGGREYRSHIVSSVKDLSLTVHEQVDVSSIFQYSTLRELTSLEIRGLFDEPDEGYLVWDEAPLHSFLTRSSCSITSLHLQWLPITDEQTATLFLQMPSLTRVHLEEYRTNAGANTIVTPLLLTSLLVDHGCSSVSTPALLPRLTDMSLVVHQDGLDPDALLKVVTSRWIPDEQYAAEVGVGCLKSFSLTVMEGDTSTVGEKLAGLLCFRDAGMRMTLSRLHVAG